MAQRNPGQLPDLECLYAALDDDEALGKLVESVAKVCGTRSAMIQYSSPQSSFDFAQMSYWPLDSHQEYFEHYGTLDPWLQEANSQGVDITNVQPFDTILPPDRFIQSEMYNELLRPLGDDTGRMLGGASFISPGRPDALIIGVHRAIADAAFSAADAAHVEQVRGHVQRILRVRALIHKEQRDTRRVEAMLDASDRAVFLVNKRMQILHGSREALRCLDLSDGLFWRQGRLLIDNGTLDREVRAAVCATIDRRPIMRSAFLCHRPSGLAAFRLVVLPAGVEGEAGALILIDDADRHGPEQGRNQWLRDAYRLTAAEAALAEGLLDGETIADIAASRKVSRETIRTQLKALFAKTETNRQADLVRMLSRMPRPPAR